MDYSVTDIRAVARFAMPRYKKSGDFTLEESSAIGYDNKEINLDYYKVKVVGIIDEESMIQQEFLEMVIQVIPKGILFGSPSVEVDDNLFRIGSILSRWKKNSKSKHN